MATVGPAILSVPAASLSSGVCMTFSVVVATYRRPESLERCLVGLERQNRRPEEILVVVHESDLETQNLLDRMASSLVKCVLVAQRGAVRQYNAGLEAATGDIVTYIDDDAVARPDYLDQIEQHFLAGPDVGGVGGRDSIVEDGRLLQGRAKRVGVVRWFGRVVGNHHLEIEGVKTVDILKGVNMSFRRVAIGNARFDTMLRGGGAQTCCDMAFSFDVGNQGWKLIYDPKVVVDHFPAARFDADKRGVPEDSAVANHAYNFYSTIRRHLKPGFRRQAALIWALWIGTTTMPGILRGLMSRLMNNERGSHVRSLASKSWQEAREQISVGSRRLI